MEKVILGFVLIIINITAFSQDVIVKKNGDEILCSVMEITTEDIKYTLVDEEKPIRNVKISEIFMILYENGKREVFKEEGKKEEKKEKGENCTVRVTDDRVNKDVFGYRHNVPVIGAMNKIKFKTNPIPLYIKEFKNTLFEKKFCKYATGTEYEFKFKKYVVDKYHNTIILAIGHSDIFMEVEVLKDGVSIGKFEERFKLKDIDLYKKIKPLKKKIGKKEMRKLYNRLNSDIFFFTSYFNKEAQENLINQIINKIR